MSSLPFCLTKSTCLCAAHATSVFSVAGLARLALRGQDERIPIRLLVWLQHLDYHGRYGVVPIQAQLRGPVRTARRALVMSPETDAKNRAEVLNFMTRLSAGQGVLDSFIMQLT